MTDTEAYREHIEYTFNAYCKIVIRHAAIDAGRQRCKRREKEISLEYLIDEKHYPLSTDDEYFSSPEPDTEYPVTICGQVNKDAEEYIRAKLMASLFKFRFE